LNIFYIGENIEKHPVIPAQAGIQSACLAPASIGVAYSLQKPGV
jgi:hypothetical protein